MKTHCQCPVIKQMWLLPKQNKIQIGTLYRYLAESMLREVLNPEYITVRLVAYSRLVHDEAGKHPLSLTFSLEIISLHSHTTKQTVICSDRTCQAIFSISKLSSFFFPSVIFFCFIGELH